MSKFEGEKGPMFGRMTEADFPSDTITLEMEPGYYTAAIRFAVVPAAEYTRQCEQRAELLEALQALFQRCVSELVDPEDVWEMGAAQAAIANATQQRKEPGA